MKKLAVMIMSAVLAVAGAIAVPQMASAASACEVDDSGILGCDQSGAKEKTAGAAAGIINAVTGFLAIVAVIVILIGGIMYATALGNPGKVQTAKYEILFGVIGLIIVMVAWAIVNIVMNVISKV